MGQIVLVVTALLDRYLLFKKSFSKENQSELADFIVKLIDKEKKIGKKNSE